MSDVIWIGADHGGYELKTRLIEHGRSVGFEFHDVGTDSEEIVRYPYFARQVAGAISEGTAQRGILICSTAIGMSIIANKFRGVRASVVHSGVTARLTRGHNDSNCLCLGGKTIGLFEAIDIFDIWVATEYEGGRHDISLGLIREAEEQMISPAPWVPSRTDL